MLSRTLRQLYEMRLNYFTYFLIILLAFPVLSRATAVEDSLMRIAKSRKDTVAVRAYCKLGVLAMNGLRFSDAKNWTKQALQLAKQLNSPLEISNVYLVNARIYYNKGIADSLELYASKAIAIKKEIKDSAGLGSSYIMMGLIYLIKEDHYKSIPYYDTASMYASGRMDPHLLNRIYNGYALSYMML